VRRAAVDERNVVQRPHRLHFAQLRERHLLRCAVQPPMPVLHLRDARDVRAELRRVLHSDRAQCVDGQV
jgi:hypothetical protein